MIVVKGGKKKKERKWFWPPILPALPDRRVIFNRGREVKGEKGKKGAKGEDGFLCRALFYLSGIFNSMRSHRGKRKKKKKKKKKRRGESAAIPGGLLLTVMVVSRLLKKKKEEGETRRFRRWSRRAALQRDHFQAGLVSFLVQNAPSSPHRGRKKKKKKEKKKKKKNTR